MKRKLFLVSVIVSFLAIVSSGSWAFFTADDIAHNVITSGNVSILVEETMLNENGEIVSFPENGLCGIMPGMSASKIVSVKNVGTAEVWVRIQTEIEIVGVNGNVLPIVSEDGTSLVTIAPLSGWLDGKDGFYYYEAPVNTGHNTGVFIDEVRFDSSMGNEYQSCSAHLSIYAEAVQAANNGENVLDAVGWPGADLEQEGGLDG